MFVILIGYSYTRRKKERRMRRRKGEMEGGTEDEREGKSKAYNTDTRSMKTGESRDTGT